MAQINLEWRRITPESAQLILANSERSGMVNRPVSNAQVGRLARDMSNGEFLKNATPIKLNRSGGLLDGQHRLRAVIQSETIQEFLFATGCDDSDILVQDIGLKRSLPEMEYVIRRGRTPITNLTLQFYVSNVMLRGFKGAAGSKSAQEKRDFFNRHLDALEWLHGLVGANNPPKDSLGLRLPAAVLAPIGRAYYTQDRQRLEDFVAQLQTGMAAPGEEAVSLLRAYIIRNTGAAGAGYFTMTERYGITETALMAFLQNRPLKILRPTKAELFPLPEEVQEEDKKPKARFHSRAKDRVAVL